MVFITIKEDHMDGKNLIFQVFERMIIHHKLIPWGLLEYLDDEDWCTILVELNNRLCTNNTVSLLEVGREAIAESQL